MSSVVTAYVLVDTLTGEVDRIREAIAGIDGVTGVFIVAGDADLIAKLEVDDPSAVKDITVSMVGGIRGVNRTETYVAMS